MRRGTWCSAVAAGSASGRRRSGGRRGRRRGHLGAQDRTRKLWRPWTRRPGEEHACGLQRQSRDGESQHEQRNVRNDMARDVRRRCKEAAARCAPVSTSLATYFFTNVWKVLCLKDSRKSKIFSLGRYGLTRSRTGEPTFTPMRVYSLPTYRNATRTPCLMNSTRLE